MRRWADYRKFSLSLKFFCLVFMIILVLFDITVVRSYEQAKKAETKAIEVAKTEPVVEVVSNPFAIYGLEQTLANVRLIEHVVKNMKPETVERMAEMRRQKE